MNGMKIFSTDVIPVYEMEDTGEKVVIGREFHERLHIGNGYATWFKDMCKYGFLEDKDYSPISVNRSDGKAGKPKIDHILKLDMAKHIAMIHRSDEGFAIHQKLIELEDHVSNADVMAEEKKLIEGYVAIVKEMALKYGACIDERERTQ